MLRVHFQHTRETRSAFQAVRMIFEGVSSENVVGLQQFLVPTLTTQMQAEATA